MRIQMYVCDNCQKESESADYWYNIISQPLRAGTTKPTPEMDLEYCPQCGISLHVMLQRLGILHEFEAPDRRHEPFLRGKILIL